MKSKLLKSSIILAMLICSYISLNANDGPPVQSSIIGTWVSEKDSQWKMVFTSTKSYGYYGSTLIETTSYVISNSTPFCGQAVPVNTHTRYLKLTDDQRATDITCYEINGITNVNLSLRPIDNGKILMFVRQ